MFSKNYIFIFLSLACTIASAQTITFQKTYGGTTGWVAGFLCQQTTDGGYSIAGCTTLGGISSDFYLMKTDSAGNILWSKTYGDSINGEAYSGQQTNDGGFVIAGYKYGGTGYTDFYLVKTNSQGNLQWSKTYGGTGVFNNGSIAWSIKQTSDSGFVIVGKTPSFGDGDDHVYLVKTDASGNLQWSKTFEANGSGSVLDFGYSVQQTTDGGYVITGYTTGASFGVGIYLIKTDSSGNLAWSKTFGDTISFSKGYFVLQTSDGGYAITGYTTGGLCLIKTDSLGSLQWSKAYAVGGVGYYLQQTKDGGYVIAGYNGDVCLIKTDSSGGLQWSKTFGGNGADYGYSVQQTSDGGYIITGYTDASAVSDIYLIKTDSLGNSGCNESSPPIIQTTPATIEGNPATITTSPASLTTIPSTIATNVLPVVTTLCSTAGVEENAVALDNILLYPNPTKGEMGIYNLRNVNYDLQIYNMLGEKVFSDKIIRSTSYTTHLDLSDGMYIVHVNSNEGKIINKIIIQK